jgi:hypothetical protein
MVNSRELLHILSENSFRELAIREQNLDLYEFNKAIQILEYTELNSLDEGVLDDLMSKVSVAIKKKIDFIKEIAEISDNKLKDLLVMFKDSRFFKLFKVLKFSIKKIVDLFKKGITTYNNIQNIIGEKIAELGGVKYIKKNLDKLDIWFNEHPVLKKIGGVAVAGLLVYIWLNMSFTPDLEYSMDFKDIIMALAGSFSLADLFASPSGIVMLTYLAVGIVAGVSMPWPGGQTLQIAGGFIFSAYRLLDIKKIKLKKPNISGLGSYVKVSKLVA